MVRNITVIGLSSHPHLLSVICSHLGVPPTGVTLGKFSNGETRVEIQDSVRGKDVYIVQSGGGHINDHLMELVIAIQACKGASANRVTAVLPLFPYSRQSDIPYNRSGAPRPKATVDSIPPTPHPRSPKELPVSNGDNNDLLKKVQFEALPNGHHRPQRSNTVDSITSTNGTASGSQPGYRQWVAQAGTLIADLITCAGADHVITMDLHDPQYQGFFDIPVDNLYGRPLLKKYIQFQIPDFRKAIIVSPDAGGAKRATAIADSFAMPFAMIHSERRPTKINSPQAPTMMLVGDVSGRVCILIDDLVDTGKTLTRAAHLLKEEGAEKVYGLVTHGQLSGNGIKRINHSDLDKLIVTNTVPQDEHRKLCPKLEVLEIGQIFAEAIRRVHHGESISVLFQYD